MTLVFKQRLIRSKCVTELIYKSPGVTSSDVMLQNKRGGMSIYADIQQYGPYKSLNDVCRISVFHECIEKSVRIGRVKHTDAARGRLLEDSFLFCLLLVNVMEIF